MRVARQPPIRGRGDPPVASGEAGPVAERVAIVVPCLNEAERIGALLDGIRAQDVRPSQVVVVDTGSSDATRDLVGQYQHRYPELQICSLHRPGLRVAAAVNAGIEAARGDIIVRLDGHSAFRNRWVKVASRRGISVTRALTEASAAS